LIRKFIRLAVGLTDGEILHFFIRNPNRNIYDFGVAGQYHHFEFPEGVIRPKLKETENVAGCGILIDSDDELTIFFTMNGILIGSAIIFLLAYFYLTIFQIANFQLIRWWIIWSQLSHCGVVCLWR
jgi:hypothetical protein